MLFLRDTAAVKQSHADDLLLAKQLGVSFAGRDMRNLDAGSIRGHIERRLGEGVRNATVNRELSLLSAAINYHNRENGDMLPNAVNGRKLPEPENRVRWITRALPAVVRESSRFVQDDVAWRHGISINRV